jgi:hypothetical protein
MSEPAQNLLRLIDKVQLKGVKEPMALYTFDWDAEAGLEVILRRQQRDHGGETTGRSELTIPTDVSSHSIAETHDFHMSPRSKMNTQAAASYLTRLQRVSRWEANRTTKPIAAIRYTYWDLNAAGLAQDSIRSVDNASMRPANPTASTVVDMSRIQPEAMLASSFFEHAEMAVSVSGSCYLRVIFAVSLIRGDDCSTILEMSCPSTGVLQDNECTKLWLFEMTMAHCWSCSATWIPWARAPRRPRRVGGAVSECSTPNSEQALSAR